MTMFPHESHVSPRLGGLFTRVPERKSRKKSRALETHETHKENRSTLAKLNVTKGQTCQQKRRSETKAEAEEKECETDIAAHVHMETIFWSNSFFKTVLARWQSGRECSAQTHHAWHHGKRGALKWNVQLNDMLPSISAPTMCFVDKARFELGRHKLMVNAIILDNPSSRLELQRRE